MDENILVQLLDNFEKRLTALEDRQARQEAEQMALNEQVVDMLQSLDRRISEAQAGLQAVLNRETKRVGGLDWKPKL